MCDRNVYAIPKAVTDVNDCFFYHTMDVPGHGLREGQWDLRHTLDEYLGGVSFKGKRVLEIGTADGLICFHMERLGAQVVAYDLSPQDEWDIIPFAGYDYLQHMEDRGEHIRQLNNAFWLCHRLFESKAKMVYGTVYAVPQEIGAVDISIFGSILLHLRDPFCALQRALALTRETVIVAEPLWADRLSRFLGKMGVPYMRFLPNFAKCEPKDAWWYLPPAVITKFIQVLGFEDVQVYYHTQQYGPWGGYKRVPYYTVVGKRTRSQVTHARMSAE